VVRGFDVKNALFEGILVQQTQNVTIRNNVVHDNDQGMFLPPAQQTGECAPSGEIPGDCGEGLHLMTVSGAKVVGNHVQNNSGGILLSDEFGPTAHNTLAGNKVLNNVFDCGITVVGHLPLAAGGGVHDNTVIGNVVNGNGVQGEGGGILLASGAPGGGVYSNRILFNVAADNGLAGVTVHKHDPASDLHGNVFIGNVLKHDALDGWGPGLPGDGDTADTTHPDHQTTGLLIDAATPITETVVVGNKISDVYYGIWTHNVAPIAPAANHFSNVVVPVYQQ
jgi:nitrous oxidase accessory protein NosD